MTRRSTGTAKDSRVPDAPQNDGQRQGLLLGIFYGLVPHTFCILFIVLSILGATAASSLIARFLYTKYLFQGIVALSLVFATASAALYLRRNGLLSMRGAKFSWKYLSILYGTTVAINLFLFLVVFPIAANTEFKVSAAAPATAAVATQAIKTADVSLQVSIPCPGHAPLIMSELKKVQGITGIKYQYPNVFNVTYDTSRLTVQKILATALFKEFPAKIRG